MRLRTEAKQAVVSGLRWLRDQLRGDELEDDDQAERASEAPAAPASAAEPIAPVSPVTVEAALAAAPDAGAEVPDAQPEASAPPAAGPLSAEESDRLYDAVVDALHTVFDPEIPVDIYELGLIYRIEVGQDRHVHVRMTLTSPNCPSAQALPEEVDEKVQAVPGVLASSVEVVFEPPWTPANMSEEARLELNM